MTEKYCQSCGMPIETDLLLGTNTDGSKNQDYCKYCYEKGTFTFNGTMEEMIEICVPHMAQSNPGMTEQTAREMMRKFFPTLMRWNHSSSK